MDSREKLIEEEHGGICDGWNIEVKSCNNEEKCPSIDIPRLLITYYIKQVSFTVIDIEISLIL